MPIPCLQDRCFAARRIRSAHGGIEHIAGFIEEDQRRASVLGFFLSAEISHSSIARSRSHRVPAHGIRAFEASNSGSHTSFFGRVLRDTQRRKIFESASPRAWKSTTRWANRELSRLIPGGIPSHETEFPSDGAARRDEQRTSTRQVRSTPSCASGKACFDPRQEFRRSSYGIVRCPSIRRREFDAAEVLSPCQVVSCVYYRHLFLVALVMRESIGPS
jgi:hypothetical protein